MFPVGPSSVMPGRLLWLTQRARVEPLSKQMATLSSRPPVVDAVFEDGLALPNQWTQNLIARSIMEYTER